MAATDQPVVNDPPSPQYPLAMTFRPPLNDQVLARRAGAMLLVLTRQALNAMETNRHPIIRAYMATRLVDESRTVLVRLRTFDIGRNQGFCLIAARARERFAHVRSLIPVVHDVSAELQLIEAELAALLGDLMAAHSDLESLMLSIRSIQKRDVRDKVAIRYFDLCIGRMDMCGGFLTFLEYLANRLPHGHISVRFGRQMHLMAAHAAILHGTGLWQSALVIRIWTRLARTRPRRIVAPAADATMQRIGLAIVRRELVSRTRSAGSARAIRAMGGLGDLLMMTPGLRALSIRMDRRIEFAIPRRYLELFEANPFVTALGLEDLPVEWYREGPIIDLTDCPASVIESRSAPNVTVNRIEIFARALGVGPRELRRHGVKPLFEPSPAGQQRAETWLEARHIRSGTFLAVQASAAESYRTWNGMAQAARSLADLMPVVVFDDKPQREFDRLSLAHENIKLAIGLDLATGLALACKARLILAPDSAFVHLAGARGLPCVGVFGPTDGALRMRAYPRAVTVSRRAELPCMPCWRNQATPCMLSGATSSQCMDSLTAETVVQAVIRLLHATDHDGASRR
jgi:ADP-heptose:LPS heptosyltransferase